MGMTDWIQYPPRVPPVDEVCKCSHKKSSHTIITSGGYVSNDDDQYVPKVYGCIICTCPKFDRSEFNDDLDNKIRDAKENAVSMTTIGKLPKSDGRAL